MISNRHNHPAMELDPSPMGFLQQNIQAECMSPRTVSPHFKPLFPNERKDRNPSPNKLHAKTKPLIPIHNLTSPRGTGPERDFNPKRLKNMIKPSVYNCENSHSYNCENDQKPAEFSLDYDGESLFYCGKCAAQLASQGFKVCKIEGLQPQKKKKGQMPNLPAEYEQHPIYQEVVKLVSETGCIEKEISNSIAQFGSLEKHYDRQFKMTEDFYSVLIETLQEMKEDHLRDLNAERDENMQIAAIQAAHLNENLNQIQVFGEDFENNVQIFFEKFISNETEENRTEVMKYFNSYRKELEMIKLKTEGELDSLKNVTTYREDALEQKIEEFQEYLITMWENEHQQFQRQPPRRHKVLTKVIPISTHSAQPHNNADNPIHINNTHNPQSQNLSNPSNHQVPANKIRNLHHQKEESEQNGNFRRYLFDENEQEPSTDITSPHFKRI